VVVHYENIPYRISDDPIKVGDMYINYNMFKRGINDKNYHQIIGQVMEIGDEVIYAVEFKSDMLSSCKKIIPLEEYERGAIKYNL